MVPDTDDPAQAAINVTYADAQPSGEIIVGPGTVTADAPFTVQAQCQGSGASFEVVTADEERRVLASGDIDCDDPPAGQFTYAIAYSGPVQVNLLNADELIQGWVRVVLL